VYNRRAGGRWARVPRVRPDGWIDKGRDMHVILRTALLLCCSNVFMTFAWYGHLKNLANRPWFLAAMVSWGIAFFEYMIQVPANRIGHQTMNVGQLKILQEVITLAVFVPFSVLYLKERIRLDYLWAGLCILGAVFFIFRSKMAGA
jgi:uncharacterized protein (DUF486 family)